MSHLEKKRKNKLYLYLLLIFVGLIVLIGLYFYQGYFEEPKELDLEEIAIPRGADGQIIKHTGYTLCYSEEHEQPYWVAYVLTPQEAFTKAVERDDSFKEDPFVNTKSAELKDYKGSGYDRGHLVPFADLSWSEQSASDSFYLSNMSPQNASLNRGKWQELEKAVRDFSLDGPICIVTGPVLSDGPYKTIGENEVSVPNWYYKVILDYDGEEVKAIGFLLPNEKCSKQLSDYAVSVDQVESLTNLDFFYLLNDSEEEKLESTFDISLWFKN